MIITIAIYLCFYRIGSFYLEDWDEAWYAEITKQMLKTNEFFVSQWNGNYMFDKPPLYMWLSAFFASLFGLNEITIRLTSAISGVSILSMTTYYSYKKWGVLPSLITFITLGLNSVFMWRIRSGNVDGLATLLILLTCFVTLWNHRFRSVILGLLFALIFLTKASLVFFPVLIFIFHEILFLRYRIKKEWKDYASLLVVFWGIIAIWLFIGTSKAGYDFLYYFLFKSDQGVSKVSIVYAKLEYIKYTFYSLQRYFSIPLIIGTAFMMLDIKKREHFLIIAYAFLLLSILSFTQRNNNWYLLPSMPFWSLVIGYGTYRLLHISEKFYYIVAIMIFLPSSYIATKTYSGHIQPMFHTRSTATHTETSLLVKKMSRQDDKVVRLDRLYPSTVYYSDRKVFSSMAGDTTQWFYISSSDLDKAIRTGGTYWIVGKKNDVMVFGKQYDLSQNIIDVNADEAILKINGSLLQ